MENKPEWFKRLEFEYNELNDRLTKLQNFLYPNSGKLNVSSINQSQLILLKKQEKVMSEYRDILKIRINLAELELNSNN